MNEFNPAMIGLNHAMQQANQMYLSGRCATLGDALSAVNAPLSTFRPNAYRFDPEPWPSLVVDPIRKLAKAEEAYHEHKLNTGLDILASGRGIDTAHEADCVNLARQTYPSILQREESAYDFMHRSATEAIEKSNRLAESFATAPAPIFPEPRASRIPEIELFPVPRESCYESTKKGVDETLAVINKINNRHTTSPWEPTKKYSNGIWERHKRDNPDEYLIGAKGLGTHTHMGEGFCSIRDERDPSKRFSIGSYAGGTNDADESSRWNRRMEEVETLSCNVPEQAKPVEFKIPTFSEVRSCIGEVARKVVGEFLKDMGIAWKD